MSTRQLDKNEWESYFDRVSKELGTRQVEIEVAALSLGDQVEAEWVVLLGLTYDPRDDILEVATEAVDHLIRRPREIHVLEGPEGLESIEVVDAEGAKQIVRLRAPLRLPAPAA